MSLRPPHRAALLSLLFAGYAGLGWLGLLATGPRPDYTVVIWPASGLGLAGLLWFGRAAWPAVFAAASIAMYAGSGDLLWSLVMAAALSAEAVVGSALVDRVAKGPAAFRHPDTIFHAVLVVLAVSAPLVATVGAVATVVAGAAPWRELAQLWTTWWLAVTAGTLVAAPLMLGWSVRTMSRAVNLLALVEALAILLALATVSLFVFAGVLTPSGSTNYSLEFLCVPFLIWAAFRLGRRAVAGAAATLCGIAVWGTMRGFGPFASANPYETVILVQTYVAVTATMAAVIAAVVTEQRRAEKQLLELATTDPLTGLANYRRLLEVLRDEVARANRTLRPFSVVFLDMNGLKKVNDRFGHLAGSRALCRIADAMRATCRAIDMPTRYGGDEFALVLPETTEEGGYIVLRRLSERLAASREQPPVTVSGGVAVFPRDGTSPTQLLQAADRVLYASRARLVSRRKQANDGFEERRTGTLF